jgi:DUF4097 and DUF4098 domain-containing protein YvlB
MSINVSSGNIKADKIKANGFTVKSTSGTVNADGELTGKIRIDSTSGTVNLAVRTNGEVYQRNLTTLIGSIRTNGERQHGRKFSDSQVLSDNIIDINVTSGNINLDLI